MTPRPPIRTDVDWTFPLPRVTLLDSGLTVWTYDLPGQFILSCDLVLELPLNSEPEGCDGVATIAVRSLDESTTPHPGPEFAKALEAVGAEFNGLVGLSTTQCLLDVPYDCLKEGLSLLAEAVTQASFDEADVARITANRLAEIEQQQSRGSYVASSTLRHALIDEDLRISRPAGGVWESVASLKRSDVSGFHDIFYTPHDAILIIAGDLKGIDAVGAARQAFGGWNPSITPLTPDTIAPGAGARELVHREGAVQADIRMGWYGIDRHDPRWAGLQVGLAIMGGMFTSRLNTVLREEKGYTYGVSMNSHPFRAGGIIDLATSTRTSAAPNLIADTLSILAATPFTQDEVDQAIGYLTLSAPLAFDTAEAVSSQAATLAAARLPVDHVTTSLSAIRRVTPDDAYDAFTTLVDPEQASIIVVADQSGLSDLHL